MLADRDGLAGARATCVRWAADVLVCDFHAVELVEDDVLVDVGWVLTLPVDVELELPPKRLLKKFATPFDEEVVVDCVLAGAVEAAQPCFVVVALAVAVDLAGGVAGRGWRGAAVVIVVVSPVVLKPSAGPETPAC